MNESLSSITSIIRKSVEVLMIFNPRGTGLGLAFGGFLKVLIRICETFITSSQFGKLDELNPIYIFLTGVFIFNIPTLYKRNRLDPNLEKILAEVEMSYKKGLLTKGQAKIHFNAIIAAQVEKSILKISVKSNLTSEVE